MTAPIQPLSLRRAYLLLKAIPAGTTPEAVAAAWTDCAARLGCAPSVLQSRLVREYGASVPRMPVAEVPRRRGADGRFKPRPVPVPWTEEEDAALRAAWARTTVSLAALGRQLGRTRSAIRFRVKALRLTPRPDRQKLPTQNRRTLLRAARRQARAAELGSRREGLPWSAAEDAKLRDVWLSGELPLADNAAARLGRSVASVRIRARRIGLLATARLRPWTKEEDALVRSLWADPTKKATRIATAMGATGRSRAAVTDRAYTLSGRAPSRPTEHAEWERLASEGVAIREIARMAKRHPRTIRRHLSMSQSRDSGAAHSIQGRAAPDPLETP